MAAITVLTEATKTQLFVVSLILVPLILWIKACAYHDLYWAPFMFGGGLFCPVIFANLRAFC